MTTFHSIARALERTSIKNPREAKRFLDLAMLRGKHPDEFNSREYNWLISHNRNEDDVVIYNGYCVIIIDNRVITLYKLPHWFGKNRFDGKNQIRRAKKYSKLHSNTIGETFELAVSF